MIFKSPYPDLSIPDLPLTQYFLDEISGYGDKPALIDGPTGRTLTYAKLAILIRQTAAGLARLDLRKGDVFAIYSPNLPEYPVAFHAVSLLGGIVTTINPTYSVEEVRNQLKNSGAIYVVTVGVFLSNAREAIAGTKVKTIYTFDAVEGAEPFHSLLYDGPVPEVSINPRTDVVALPYSSGTSGVAKGVMLTHRNIVANIIQTLNIPGAEMMTLDDRILGFLPFFHIYGFVVVMQMALVRGGTIITMPRFDMIQFLELIQKYKITRTNLAPPVLVGLAKHPLVGQYDTSSLVELFSGAAPLGGELAAEVGRRMNCSVIQGYGMTETSPVTHVYNRSLLKGEKLNSIGPPVANTEILLVDTETGLPVTTNARGELWVRGPQVMKGYLNNNEATLATLDKDGWLHTGDIGYADDEGMFYIVDRLKELIKYKGYQVAPAELEALLLTHAAIADAAVIPKAHEECGEIPKAYIVLKQNATCLETEIMEWVAARVAPQKKIRCVEFIDVIPKSATGKILRRVLVEKERKMTNTK